jgi:hypothetical protein
MMVMNANYDFAIRGPDDSLRAVIEVKGGKWDDDRIRRTAPYRLAGLPPSFTHFYLLVTPTTVFVWSGEPTERPPDYEFATRELFSKYVKHMDTPVEQLDAHSLEILVGAWLHDLTDAGRTAPDSFAQTGIVDAVQGGRIYSNYAA